MWDGPDYGMTGFMNELSDLNLALGGVGRKTFFIKRFWIDLNEGWTGLWNDWIMERLDL